MNTEQELRLLPCPFCGWKEPKIVTNRHANMSWVACADCGLETPSETGTSAEDAAEYWNRRSSSDKPFASPPAVAAGGVTDDTVDYVMQYGGNCRDCADENGTCPHSGLPCDVKSARKAIGFVLRAITYGTRRGHLAALAVRDEGIREGWQPIETAPKDGTEVLLWGVCWRDHQAYAPDRNVGWWAGDHLGWQTRGQDEDIDPTHWRPLPTPPSRGEGV